MFSMNGSAIVGCNYMKKPVIIRVSVRLTTMSVHMQVLNGRSIKWAGRSVPRSPFRHMFGCGLATNNMRRDSRRPDWTMSKMGEGGFCCGHLWSESIIFGWTEENRQTNARACNERQRYKESETDEI